jgi:NADPH2:quinone reductase
MMVSFGNASGPVDPVAPLILTQKGSLYLTDDELRWRAGDVLSWVASGTLRITVDREYPLADAGLAHTDLAGRKTSGKLLLVP